MRYWDEEHPELVVSRALETVGSNATLIRADIEKTAPDLKAIWKGEIAVGAPPLCEAHPKEKGRPAGAAFLR